MGFHQPAYRIPQIDTFVKSEDERSRERNYVKKIKVTVNVPRSEEIPEVKAKDFSKQCDPLALCPSGKWSKIYSAPEENSEGVAGT